MMEITKISECYNLSEVNLDTNWKMNGTINKEVNGALSINFSVDKGGLYIGNLNYNKPSNGSNINISYNVSEENKLDFMSYSNGIVDQIFEYLKLE